MRNQSIRNPSLTTSGHIFSGTDRQVSISTKFVVGLIKAYRRTLSPLLAYFISCRHYPSCSQYGLEAVSRYGAWRGGWMTIKRVLRCNPFFPGGYDPVK